ncbi:MAG: response regulator [Paludibacter sp.]
MKKVLIIEDDVNLGVPLMGILEMLNFEVRHLINGDNVMQDFLEFKPDIIILDVILNAKMDGYEVAQQIRTLSNTPILFTTSLNGNEDFEKAFAIVNTDYVRKPYRLLEVQLRMEGLLKRQETPIQPKKEEELIHIGNYTFNPQEQVLIYDFDKQYLNKNESVVLTILFNHINLFISRNEIVTLVWKNSNPSTKEGSLNNILTNLRKYLKNDKCLVLDTRVGLGVRLSIK